ncbi:MAG: DNA polymerase III subunit delta' [Steroidobacteraceae bacterium]|jgi:DNA polymerase-3 subunit delta'
MSDLSRTIADLPLTASLPWLTALQSALEDSIARDRLAHAVLIQVSPGRGGDWLARWLAARLYCSAAAGPRPCGECLSCRRVVSGEQPDLLHIQPIEDSKEIRIDQVRELTTQLALTSHAGGRKVVIITPADKLNRAAANALLKTLEEPTRGSLLLLVTGEPSRLPATVQSRCMRLVAPRPARAELVAWLRTQRSGNTDWNAVLEVLGDEPLVALGAESGTLEALRHETQRALEAAARGGLDPVETAELWGKEAYAERLACIEAWLLVRLREWASGKAGIAPRAWFEALDETREARQWADTPINKPLVLERLLWRLGSLESAQRKRSQPASGVNRGP